MGVCFCADENSKAINDYLQKNGQLDDDTKKLLFLGPGGSGKSTFFKQLQCLHDGGFSKTYATELKSEIRSQIILQMKTAIRHYYIRPDPSNTDDNTYEQRQMSEAVECIESHDNSLYLSKLVTESIKYVWHNCKEIETVFESESQKDVCNKILDESTADFWNDIDRIAHDNYYPTEQDIINVRFRTTGIIEMKCKINNSPFWFVDVGGQKNERRKWIQSFDSVTAVIFIVSLSSFNELMFEDKSTNAMEDSFGLFSTTLTSKAFNGKEQEVPFILFLNKIDLFRKKVADVPITKCKIFEDFHDEKYQEIIMNGDTKNNDTTQTDVHDFDQCLRFVKHKYVHINESKFKNRIYAHFTCATDRANVNSVFNDVQKIIVRSNLFDQGV